MIPVLVVEGVAHKVEAIDYLDGKPKTVIIEQEGRKVFYWDKSVSANPNALDLEDAIVWQGRYDPVYKAIGDYIEFNQKEVQGLATVIADAASENTFVPPPKIKEREHLKQRIFGLMDAQEIVGAYMQEDVDLSGGEEIATE